MKQTLKEFAVGFAVGGAYTLLTAGVAGATPETLMVNVPNFGPSRMETVSMCLGDAGVDRYQALMTDMEWETFEGCMVDNT